MVEPQELEWRPERLRCQRLASPNAIGTASPMLSWQLPAAAGADAAGGVPGGGVDDRRGRWLRNGPLGQRVGRVHNYERPLSWPAARVTPSGLLVGPVPDGLGGHEPLERAPLFSGRPPSSQRLERVVGGPPATRGRAQGRAAYLVRRRFHLNSGTGARSRFCECAGRLRAVGQFAKNR